MATVTSATLRASVVDSVDFDAIFKDPSLKALRGLVALDIYIEMGGIKVGQQVVLASKTDREIVTVTGIELKVNFADPKKIRVICSKPKTIPVPLRNDCEWTLSEP